MIITFEQDKRKYSATVESIEEAYEAIKDGLIAMSYYKDTAQQVIEELKENEEGLA